MADFRMMLVDDERVVRSSMRENVDWKAHRFDLVADCENGREALERIPEVMPDVVLTDICMPFMDGLELARHIAERYPHIHVIILTGYDQFEYAQQAVKLQVRDFILKPVTQAELVKVLDRLAEVLDKERSAMHDRNRLFRQVAESRPLLRERFLNRLSEGTLSDDELQRKWLYHGLPNTKQVLKALIFSIDDMDAIRQQDAETPIDVWHFAVCNICEEILREGFDGIVFQNRDGHTVAVLSDDSEEALSEMCAAAASKIQSLIVHHLPFSVTVGAGPCVQKLQLLPDSVHGALRALDYRYTLGKGNYIPIIDLECLPDQGSQEMRELRNQLKKTLRTGSPKDVECLIIGISEQLKARKTPMDRVKTLVRHILSDYADSMDELLGPDQTDWVDLTSWNVMLESQRDLNAVKNWLTNLFQQGAVRIVDSRKDLQSEIVQKAEQIIRERFSDEGLTLQVVLKELCVSSSYFSFVFKQRTGETFVEALTRYRMDKAMTMMKSTSLKNYEIAERIGMPDPHYFSNLFKKAAGMTPSEYRERMKA